MNYIKLKKDSIEVVVKKVDMLGEIYYNSINDLMEGLELYIMHSDFPIIGIFITLLIAPFLIIIALLKFIYAISLTLINIVILPYNIYLKYKIEK